MVTAEWRESTTDPGYREKVIPCGNCTVVVLRPILDQEEQTKREQKAKTEIERGLRDYLLRKEVHRNEVQ
jgi:hypothetical protein